MILSEEHFVKLQGGTESHLRHVSGLHWVVYVDTEAGDLASFPNLESLEFDGCNRQCSGGFSNSEWWFRVPAVTERESCP